MTGASEDYENASNQMLEMARESIKLVILRLELELATKADHYSLPSTASAI